MSAKLSPTLSAMGPRSGAGAVRVQDFSWGESTQRNAWIALVVSAVALVWSYWMMFADAAAEWDQPQYSHGWILPLIALFMMWRLRPNKDAAPHAEMALRAIGGVSLALVAAGQMLEGFGALQGVGLAVACLGAFACTMWGQPFATLATGEARLAAYEKPGLLWALALVGAGITTLGLVGIGGGPLNPDVLGALGMFIVVIGFVLAAAIPMPSPVVSWHEIGVGTLVMLFSTAAWMTAVYYDRMPLAQMAFIATAIAILMIVGGTRLVRWAGAPVAFLLFMFPLPSLIERQVLGLLQKVAVVLSEMVYTVIGVSAIRTGNHLELPGLEHPIPMEVAEACSGLSMTNILLAMCVAMVILMDRPWWDRLIVLLSALPIAIIANVFRIVLTGLIWMLLDRMYVSDPDYAAELRDPVHAWLGLIVMMPFALGLLLLELKVLSRLSVPEEHTVEGSSLMGGGAPVR